MKATDKGRKGDLSCPSLSFNKDTLFDEHPTLGLAKLNVWE
jgi:hypothetical protein